MCYHLALPKTVRQRLQQMTKARRSVSPKTMDKVLTDTGFAARTGKGDHIVYKHERYAELVTIDPRNPLLPAYVTKSIKAIEAVLEAEEKEKDNEQDEGGGGNA